MEKDDENYDTYGVDYNEKVSDKGNDADANGNEQSNTEKQKYQKKRHDKSLI